MILSTVQFGARTAAHRAGEDRRAMHPAEIVARDLSVRYRGKPAFAGISLGIPAGQITAVIGPSGCGKTSFLMCLNRLTDLVPHAEVTGSLEIEDLDVLAARTNLIALRREVGMIFQKPNPFPLSVRRNLALPLREHGVRDRKRIDEIAEGALRDVGLWDEVKDRLDEPALALSGGQQQRLCIARTLVLRPRVLLLDEPCSSLDPISMAAVERHIASLRGRFTLVIVTHNLAQARRLADRVAFFWIRNGTGCLVEQGTAREVFEAPRDPLTEAYIKGLEG